MILLRMTDRRENMQLRKYTPSDCVELTELFYNTVHKVNVVYKRKGNTYGLLEPEY